MKEYILTKNILTYLRICWRYKIIAKWIKSSEFLKNKDRYILYTKYHVYHHDKLRPYRVNIFKLK